MTSQPLEPARKGYYLVRENRADTSSGYSFTNQEQALVDGRLAGTHQHQIPGSPHPVFVGIPPLRENPKVVILGGSRNARDYYGASPRFVSTRAKELLERIDPAGFEFVECETVTRKGEQVEPYWWVEVIRWIDKFDEERSVFEWTRDRFPEAPDAQNNPTMFALYDIQMNVGFPEDFHAFWLAHYRNQAVFSDVLVNAWREAKFTGAVFTPLQAPSGPDLADQNSFVNFPYWTERARKP